MTLCNLCPNHCSVDRDMTLGACNAPNTMYISRIAPHYYEEPPISGNRGSGTVFFSGCTMACVFCQNSAISRKFCGNRHTPFSLSEKIRELEDLGVHNINFVTPTHYAHLIKATLDIYKPAIPICYNTSSYDSLDTLKSLDGYIDIYLPDYKYSDTRLAALYSNRPKYPSTAITAIAEMLRQQPVNKYANNCLSKGVIIRHLVLPQAVPNTKGVLDNLQSNFGVNLTLSLMSQYTPIPGLRLPLSRRLKPLEYKIVVNYAQTLGFDDVFIQELDSAESSYIPTFQV